MPSTEKLLELPRLKQPPVVKGCSNPILIGEPDKFKKPAGALTAKNESHRKDDKRILELIDLYKKKKIGSTVAPRRNQHG